MRVDSGDEQRHSQSMSGNKQGSEEQPAKRAVDPAMQRWKFRVTYMNGKKHTVWVDARSWYAARAIAMRPCAEADFDAALCAEFIESQDCTGEVAL